MRRFRIDRGEEHLLGGYGVRPKGMSRKEWKGKMHEDPSKYRRFSINVPTPDDFCPTLEDGTVEVSVLMLNAYNDGIDPYTNTYWIRTCVWGGDDMGFDRDEEFPTKALAEDCIQRRVKEVCGWSIVTIKMLKELHFVGA